MAGRGRLTKRTVDAAVPRASRYIVWCGELHGFGLRVEPTGKKTFLIRYRAGGGRSGTLRQATVGRYGTITVEEARATARRLLGAAASGGDPLGDRKKARQAGVTVGEICDWYITEVTAGRILGRKGRPIKASTIEGRSGPDRQSRLATPRQETCPHTLAARLRGDAGEHRRAKDRGHSAWQAWSRGCVAAADRGRAYWAWLRPSLDMPLGEA